jgi:hypothetical protein
MTFRKDLFVDDKEFRPTGFHSHRPPGHYHVPMDSGDIGMG